MSKIVIELPDVPVSGDVFIHFVASDPSTFTVDSSAELKCRIISLPNCVVNLKPSFSYLNRSDEF